MPKHERHERYEELSVLAAISDTSFKDLSGLKEHIDECSDCRDNYKQFNEEVLPRLTIPNFLAFDLPIPDSDPQSIRSRFLERARADGMTFSSQALNPGHAKPMSDIAANRGMYVALAASLILAGGIGGYRIAHFQGLINQARSEESTIGKARPIEGASSAASSAAIQRQTGVRVNPSPKSDNSKRILELEQQLRESAVQLASEGAKINALESAGAVLHDQNDRQQQQLASTEVQTRAAEETAADLRTQLDKAQTQASSNETALLLDEAKVKDLGDQLAQARETTSANHEVGSLMAERNLHIVDVYDTDGEGKTKPIFGRIFLVGNKQLRFYAYDLNASRLESAKYAYRVWGEKLGPGQSAKALGAFYSDDATQKRWVFECDDAKVLAEIDSVFVTFEPANRTSDHPRGPKLMYAYLRGDANHP